MPFVKLDCNILRSTLWFERLQREVFITALLMAEPMFTDKPMPQLQVNSLEETGWIVPPSGDTPYGFIAAAGVGIVRYAVASNEPEDMEPGLEALEKLGEPERSSRTPDFEGRRLVRVDGGYIILNYGKYRERDYTAAERQKRFRDKKKRNTVTSDNNALPSRNITEAEAEAHVQEKEKEKEVEPSFSPSFSQKQKKKQPTPYYPPPPSHRIPTDEELEHAKRIAHQETTKLRAALYPRTTSGDTRDTAPGPQIIADSPPTLPSSAQPNPDLPCQEDLG